jgi:hypothetical protein
MHKRILPLKLDVGDYLLNVGKYGGIEFPKRRCL